MHERFDPFPYQQNLIEVFNELLNILILTLYFVFLFELGHVSERNKSLFIHFPLFIIDYAILEQNLLYFVFFL
jgi:hypothetical protein